MFRKASSNSLIWLDKIIFWMYIHLEISLNSKANAVTNIPVNVLFGGIYEGKTTTI